MEFACGFVYVPPSVSQKEQRSNVTYKRSALLPPANWLRPRSPPPPPPGPSAEVKVQKPALKVIQQLEKNKEVKREKEREVKSAVFYENAKFHLKAGTPSRADATQPPQTARKTALLPPHMRPAARSPSSSSSSSFTYSEPLDSCNNQTLTYDLPRGEPDLNAHPVDPNYSYNIPEGSGREVKVPGDRSVTTPTQTTAPALPPRPPFLKAMPLYVVVLPSSSSPTYQASPSAPPPDPAPAGSADKGPLPGNPNVILASLGKLLSEESMPVPHVPTLCLQCGSVLDSIYDNSRVNECYFCHWDPTSSPPNTPQDGLFLLNPSEQLLSPADSLLLFCIDISGSMSITSQVTVGEQVVHRSRLQFVQDAVLQCVERLSEQQPDKRVGLISFNNQVTIHGYEDFPSHFLFGDALTDSDYLKEAAAIFPSPPPLSQTRRFIHTQLLGLSESGTTALGPAALLAVAMASRHPGSKVIICTDGKANTDLGNLEVEDTDARTLLSSTIFYQELGEYAADQGVTVSVLSIEGTDCRLDELGRLADRTGGTVVIASPSNLHPEFEQIIENRTIATHCHVTLLLPKTLCVRGEREAGHKGTREVGNVDLGTELTFQFGAAEMDPDASPVSPGSHVSIQLQIRYRQLNGQKMLRVLTSDRVITEDSMEALSSLSLAIIQLNSSQASAALAVRGRFVDAQREGELQRKLIERAIENNRSAEDKETYQDWVKTMEPLYNNIHNFTRRKSVISDSQSLTDAGAVLLYTMKRSNRKTLKNQHKP